MPVESVCRSRPDGGAQHSVTIKPQDGPILADTVADLPHAPAAKRELGRPLPHGTCDIKDLVRWRVRHRDRQPAGGEVVDALRPGPQSELHAMIAVAGR